MTDRARQPKGSPVGGEFAPMGGAESGVQLLVLDHASVASLLAHPGPADRSWGQVNLSWGSRTPWGEAQHVDDIAEGIARVGTASHGGFKLSAQRNREVPAPLRREGGWYEEDCEFHIVTRTFPELEAFHLGGYTTEELRQISDESVKRWFGRAWAEVTGNPVPQETLDDEAREAARKAETRARHEARPDNERILVSTVALDGFTDAQQRAVTKDLDQRWRNDDGTVQSLREILAGDGVTGREKRYADGKTTYALVQQDKVSGPIAVLKVSKATYDAVSSQVPDTVSPLTRARDERKQAQHKLRDACMARTALQSHQRMGYSAADDRRLRALEDQIARHTADANTAEALIEELTNDDK